MIKDISQNMTSSKMSGEKNQVSCLKTKNNREMFGSLSENSFSANRNQLDHTVV